MAQCFYLKLAQTLMTMFENMVMYYMVLYPQYPGLYTASDNRGQLLPQGGISLFDVPLTWG